MAQQYKQRGKVKVMAETWVFVQPDPPLVPADRWRVTGDGYTFEIKTNLGWNSMRKGDVVIHDRNTDDYFALHPAEFKRRYSKT
jgi:hypothetical protein